MSTIAVAASAAPTKRVLIQTSTVTLMLADEVCGYIQASCAAIERAALGCIVMVKPKVGDLLRLQTPWGMTLTLGRIERIEVVR